MALTVAMVRAGRCGAERGQIIAEFALAVPAATLLICGVLQCGMLAYASAVARYAAFRGLRAAAVAAPMRQETAARLSALAAVAAAPGLTPVWVSAREAPFRAPRAAAGRRRLVVRVRVAAPRLMPLPSGGTVVSAQATMPMEPVW